MVLWNWNGLAAIDAEPRRLKVVSGVATVAALVLIGRLTVFMVAPERVGYALFPTSEWEYRHSCFSAYYVAGLNVREANVYDEALYTALDDDRSKVRRPLRLGSFNVDVFE
jgi:hypothetical protein